MSIANHPKPGEHLDYSKMPIYTLFARLGKQVLRPGGMELTRRMLNDLDIGSSDEVVEFAPGVGATARLTLARNPARYTAIERDAASVGLVSEYLTGPNQRCVQGRAEETGLPEASATVVYGEAMLTMQTAANKARIVAEAARLLKPGGRYGFHEVCLTPDDLDEETKSAIEKSLTGVTHVGTRPQTQSEWRALVEGAGFEIQKTETAPFHLLEPRRVLADEGLWGTLRIVAKTLRNGAARKRVLAMRRAIRRHQNHLAAITFVAVKADRS